VAAMRIELSDENLIILIEPKEVPVLE